MALTLEDKQEIEELLSRYAWWIDSYLPVEEFYSIFTEDAVLTSPLSGRFEGRDAQAAFVEYRSHHPSWGPGRSEQLRHAITNVLIEGDGDHATARAILLDFDTAAGPGGERASRLLLTGHYECEAVRIEGSWKLRSRILIIDSVSGGASDNSGKDYREVTAEALRAAAAASDPADSRFATK
jgi:hypothetical protein